MRLSYLLKRLGYIVVVLLVVSFVVFAILGSFIAKAEAGTSTT